MFSHGYIKRDFDVDEWARPEFLEKAAEEVLKEEWARRSGASSHTAVASRWRVRGSGSRRESHAGRAEPPTGRRPVSYCVMQ